jgi:hypothetical protein
VELRSNEYFFWGAKQSYSEEGEPLEGNWKQFTGKAKEQWGKLTDDELTQIKWQSRTARRPDPGEVRIREGQG